MVGICSLEENASDSPLDMLNAMKPYGTPEEQEFIDLIVKFSPGLPDLSVLPRIYQGRFHRRCRSRKKAAYAGDEEDGRGSSSRPLRGGPHFSIEHLKNMLPPEQQSKLETAQLLMQTMQGI